MKQLLTSLFAGSTGPRAKKSEQARQYRRPPSMAAHLPWMEWDEEVKAIVLEDGESMGTGWEIEPCPTEARPQQELERLRDAIQSLFSRTLPEEDDPWVVQFYCEDEPDLSYLVKDLRAHVHPKARGTKYTEHYLQQFEQHVQDVSRPGGLFVDNEVTGAPWRGQRRRVRMVLYRRRGKKRRAIQASEELSDVADRVERAMHAAGIGLRRMEFSDYWEWLIPWFNPAPEVWDRDPRRLLKEQPMPNFEAEEKPHGLDLAEALLQGLDRPRSDAERNIWWLDDTPHKIISVQGLIEPPSVGHLTGERRIGDHAYAVMDRLPEGTRLVMTITVVPQDQVRTHLDKIEHAAVGDSAEAILAKEEAAQAKMRVAKGDKLIKTYIGLYMRGATPRPGEDLEKHRERATRDMRLTVNAAAALLQSQGMRVIAESDDLIGLDTWIRELPMNHVPAMDKSRGRSRYQFSRHVAALAPLYGRSKGTGHPGIVFFNRGAEPLTFDPLDKRDRKQNGHMLILGPSGAGKSVTLNYLLAHIMAVWRPRIFLVEAGNSMGLLCDEFEDKGLKVHRIKVDGKDATPIPPFADAIRALENQESAEIRDMDDDEDDEDEVKRDYLGEMEIQARLMITGGEAKEDARMTRADRMLIRTAILDAARRCRDMGKDTVNTSDVVEALANMEGLTTERRKRAQEMADSMRLFCSGQAAELFDRPGESWPEADVTHFELGRLAREGYEDQLAVAYNGLMSRINDIIEAKQYEDRMTLMVTDEGHIITTNPLLATAVTKATKMWRKFGAWYWNATQNLADFPDESRKMLGMMEWWLCLWPGKDEIEQIKRFRDLSEEQASLLSAVRKQPGCYTEGVALGNNFQALFRVVPPAHVLALAMTEKHEKVERMKIMEERGCSEIEAAYVITERIREKRVQR